MLCKDLELSTTWSNIFFVHILDIEHFDQVELLDPSFLINVEFLLRCCLRGVKNGVLFVHSLGDFIFPNFSETQILDYVQLPKRHGIRIIDNVSVEDVRPHLDQLL